MEPPPPRQRRQWALGNERVTLAELAAAGVKTPERDPWPHSHHLDYAPHRTTHSAGSSKAEALFPDRRTSAESHLDSRRTSEKRVSHGGFREREQGFNLQLSGANEERVKAQLKRQVQGGGRRSSGHGGGTEDEHRRRRNWQRAQQLVIRTDDGAALPVEETRGGRKSRGEVEVETGAEAGKTGGGENGAEDSLKDGSQSAGVNEDELGGQEKGDGGGKEGERSRSEAGRDLDRREIGDVGKKRGAGHVAEVRGLNEDADFTVVQEIVEPDRLLGTELSVVEKPHFERHAATEAGKGRDAATGANLCVSASYESEDFEAYEESFEEDFSLGEEGGMESERTQHADAETPLQVASKGTPPNRESIDQTPLESPQSVPVPPLETVDSPDMIRSFDAKSARFGDRSPSSRPAEQNGTAGRSGSGTAASSVTYSSVQDWGTVRSEAFGSMEVVDVSEEADGGETYVTVTAVPRPSAMKRKELEVEEIEEEELSEVESPGGAQLELETSAVVEESDSSPDESAPTPTRSGHFVEEKYSPTKVSPGITFAGSPLGKPGRVRPLSALSNPKPAESVPRAPLTARNGTKPGTDVSLVLEAVRRENAKALAAQLERLAQGQRAEERKSETEAERRESRSDEREIGGLEKEGRARRPSRNGEEEAVARMQSLGGKPAKPLLPELNERLRLLDTQKQEYLLEVIQKLERCQGPEERAEPGDGFSNTRSTSPGSGKAGDASAVAERRRAELAAQCSSGLSTPGVKQTGLPHERPPKSPGRGTIAQPLTPEPTSVMRAPSPSLRAPHDATAQRGSRTSFSSSKTPPKSTTGAKTGHQTEPSDLLPTNPSFSKDSPSPRAGRRRVSMDDDVTRTTSYRGEPGAEASLSSTAPVSSSLTPAPVSANRPSRDAEALAGGILLGPRSRAGNRSPFLNVITTDTPSPTSSPESVFGVTSSSGQPGKGRRGKATETERNGGQSVTERNDANGAEMESSGRSGSAVRHSRRSSLGLEGRSAVRSGARLSGTGEMSLAQRASGRRSVNRTSDGDPKMLRPSDRSEERGLSLNRGHETARAVYVGDSVSPGKESPNEAFRPRGRSRMETPSVEEAPEGFRRKGRDRRAPSALEQSLDSLAFFRHSHAGRLHIPAEPLPCPEPLPDVYTPEGQEGVVSVEKLGGERTEEPDSERGVLAGGRKSALGGTELGTGLQRAGFRPASRAEKEADKRDARIADALVEPSWLAPAQPTGVITPPGVSGARLDRGAEDDALSSFVHPAESLDVTPAPEEPRGKLLQASVPMPTSFTIPCEPRGSQLTVHILENWGDPFYVGLSGLELFDSAGEPLSFRSLEKQLRAEPPDLNILSGYGSDPRTVDKLLDGVNWTCDDLHHWLAPFTPGEAVSIHVSLDDVTTLGMIRVWNYNCSRIHSFRGVRTIEVRLDDRVIFVGEVRKAPGIMEGALRCAECVLFTESENALSALERYDLKRYSDTANALKAAADTSGSVVESLDLDKF
ncbi:hypothetical protein KFL_001820150 [Klebsormidium nitens]|uniref:KATNIP domain-containing protein n=1 Tax=Klebsormidium nitens TaxID=105231 RepID=A0A1Y1I2S2_KLENI|nr:hypothetical protein KFL_001820150 [Klebsormidium nitens]|eukprot:GAQ84262.1 hypothetical protein KFL_001820150 [Klebsormidium nitens]